MNLFQPKKINYDFKDLPNAANPYGGNQNAGSSPQSRSRSPEDRRKPVLDYKIKINQLEKEIHTMKQSYDDTRTKNGHLRFHGQNFGQSRPY